MLHKAPFAPEEVDLATRAVWLSYVGRYNQSQIAERLGVSRIKVHRLISSAHALGLVKVNIEHDLAELVALEERLVRRYSLQYCAVVPSLDARGESAGFGADLVALGMAGARFLRRQLQSSTPLTIGLGWGRTLAAVAQQTLRERFEQHRFVALIGSLTRHSSANPYDVIHRMVDRTESEGFYLPIPYIADTLADKTVLLAQKSVQDILALARSADVCMVGIGHGGADSFLKSTGFITDAEFEELSAAGAVGDLIGKFFDRDGRLVDSEVNERSMGLELSQLADCNAVAIAGGEDKTEAIAAALRSGTLAGLITDERVAGQLGAGEETRHTSRSLEHQ